MADFDQVIITFHTQYGALRFKRKFGAGCELHPVPRSLSSSCGTAAFLQSVPDSDFMDDYVEAVYEKDGKEWKKIM